VEENAVPIAGSKAIDAGVPVSGITDGFLGTAPDLGAYERGGMLWRPGADWDPSPTVRPDIAFTPRAEVTEKTMPQDGLLLWLDASAQNTLQQAGGALTRWLDRRMNGRTAIAGAGFSAISGMGRTVVHCDGKSALTGGTLRKEKGPATVLLVANSASAALKPWQRLFISWSGEGPDWVSPSFIIMRPDGANPKPFGPRSFLAEQADEVVLDHVRLAGAVQGPHQSFLGDLAEVLVFDRPLRFDESLAIRHYLRAKWSLEK
jgi:hypothetical protein